jgi:Bacterial Ig domain
MARRRFLGRDAGQIWTASKAVDHPIEHAAAEGTGNEAAMGIVIRRAWALAAIIGMAALFTGVLTRGFGAGAARASGGATNPLSIKWLWPRDGSTVRGLLSGSACDVTVHDATAISKVTFGLDGSTLTTDTASPYTCEIRAADLSPGMHILRANAYDAAGNSVSAHIYVSTRWTGRPRITVTVQGDSLTVGSWWRIPGHLGRNYKFVSYSAHWGRPSIEGLSLLRRQRLGNVVVFALGTNDTWWPPSVYRQHLTSVLQLIGPHRCLVVPTIWREGPDRARNAVLYAVARRYGPARMRLALWSEAVASGRVHLSSDGTHPGTQAAWAGRAAVVAAAIRACAANQARG